jgi:SpoVK/Ycf46/Vps4 family AAA+-type ATPase
VAAKTIAGELDFDSSKVDLGCAISKYIGETEKNLGRIFEAAERSIRQIGGKLNDTRPPK